MGTTDSSSPIVGSRPLFITTGSRGDVQPFLALARALAESGAGPVVAAPRRFGDLATRFGVEFVGLDDSILDLQDDLVGAGPVRAALSLGRIRPLMRRWLDDLAELANKEAGRADVVVFTQKALGGASIAERLGTPGLPAQLIPTGPPTSDFQVPFAPAGTPRSLVAGRGVRGAMAKDGGSVAVDASRSHDAPDPLLQDHRLAGDSQRLEPPSAGGAARVAPLPGPPRVLAVACDRDSSGGRRALPGRRAATRGRRLRKHDARRPGAARPRGGGRPAPCGAQGDPPGRMGGVERVGG